MLSRRLMLAAGGAAPLAMATAARAQSLGPDQLQRLIGRAMQAQVEELGDNKVRLIVDVPSADVKHAVDHAASDLAESVKIPGFRKGKVPLPVLVQRIGRDRIYAEAVREYVDAHGSLPQLVLLATLGVIAIAPTAPGVEAVPTMAGQGPRVPAHGPAGRGRSPPSRQHV